MKIRLFILVLFTALLSSCSQYKLTSTRGEEYPCYSTWHPYPKNS